MAKKNCFSVINNGIEYLVMNHGLVLCSKPTKRLANERALELAKSIYGKDSICVFVCV